MTDRTDKTDKADSESRSVEDLVARATSYEAKEQLNAELKLAETRRRLSALESRYSVLEKEHLQLKKGIGLLEEAGLPLIHKISKKDPTGNTEATAFLMASDWHVEEIVDPTTVNDLNTYDPEIARASAEQFWRVGVRLSQIIGRDVRINTLVVALLGDFITNNIHEEFLETNAVPPMEAVRLAQDLIASGIQFILNNTKYDLIIPCHSGNHGRITKYVHAAFEYGHSLEYLMYHSLATMFASEPRVQFRISTSYHSYLDLYGLRIRLHHGHATLYKGGVGGLYIPVNKAIAQWNRAIRADLDLFGHYHQMKDGGNFLSNGSLIGTNPYSIRIKADYEPPRQTFFVIDSKHGRTFTCPILVRDVRNARDARL
jgi:hypothetical protein